MPFTAKEGLPIPELSIRTESLQLTIGQTEMTIRMKSFSGTTMGVIGLVLEAAPFIIWDTLKARLEQNANRLAGNYTYSSGVSTEFSHGRIDCGATLTVLVENRNPRRQTASMRVVNPVQHTLMVRYQLEKDLLPAQFKLLDPLGRTIMKPVKTNQPNGALKTDLSFLKSGIYFIQLSDKYDQIISSKRIIKN